jgi:hypothetical protein
MSLTACNADSAKREDLSRKKTALTFFDFIILSRRNVVFAMSLSSPSLSSKTLFWLLSTTRVVGVLFPGVVTV